MNNTSGNGIRVQLRASVTFPAGISLSQFVGDADPVDVASLKVGDKEMGINGDLIVWANANAIELTLNVIPSSDDDTLLGILLQANRPGRGKRIAKDVLTAVVQYPDGGIATLTEGAVMEGNLVRSASSSGKIKTKMYKFAFENMTGF